jgi:hypothetical protein
MIYTIGAIWIAALALLVIFFSPLRKMDRAIRCPIHGTDVRVRLLEALPEERPIEVIACSALTPPTAVTCGQRCLALLAHRPMSAAGRAS